MPADYEGAYEKHLRLKGLTGKVNMLHFANLDTKAALAEMEAEVQEQKPIEAPQAPDAEHEETDMFFAFMEANQSPSAPSYEHNNRWAELSPSDAEELDIVHHLTSFAHSVQVGPRESQRKKNNTSPKPLTVKQIKNIAAKVNKGELKLPDVDLGSGAEYEAVWALLDSGSSVHVVNGPNRFPGATVKKPARGAKGFTVANGKNIPDLGTLETPVKLPDGTNKIVLWKCNDGDSDVV